MNQDKLETISKLEPEEFSTVLATLNDDQYYQLVNYIDSRIEDKLPKNVIEYMKLADFNTSIIRKQAALHNDDYSCRLRSKVSEYQSYLHGTIKVIELILSKWDMGDGFADGFADACSSLMDHYKFAIVDLAEDAVRTGSGDNVFNTIAIFINSLPAIPRIIVLFIVTIVVYCLAVKWGGVENAKHCIQHIAILTGCSIDNKEEIPSLLTIGAKIGVGFMAGGVKKTITSDSRTTNSNHGNQTFHRPQPLPQQVSVVSNEDDDLYID